MLRELDSDRSALGVRSYGLSVTTMEEVFLNVSRAATDFDTDKKDAEDRADEVTLLTWLRIHRVYALPGVSTGSSLLLVNGSVVLCVQVTIDVVKHEAAASQLHAEAPALDDSSWTVPGTADPYMPILPQHRKLPHHGID